MNIIIWIIAISIFERRRQKIIHNSIINSNRAIEKVRTLDEKLKNKINKALHNLENSKQEDISILISEQLIYTSKVVKTFYNPTKGITFTSESNGGFVITNKEIELDNLAISTTPQKNSQVLAEQKTEDYSRNKHGLRRVK